MWLNQSGTRAHLYHVATAPTQVDPYSNLSISIRHVDLVGMERIPGGFAMDTKPSDAKFVKVKLIQSTWFDEIEAMVKENTDLAFFEVDFYIKVGEVKAFCEHHADGKGGNRLHLLLVTRRISVKARRSKGCVALGQLRI